MSQETPGGALGNQGAPLGAPGAASDPGAGHPAHSTDIPTVVRLVMGAADMAAIRSTGTRHEATRAAVTAAIECAVANGLIQITPTESWPEYIAMDPPYRLPWWKEATS